jgi:hypothetical protein
MAQADLASGAFQATKIADTLARANKDGSSVFSLEFFPAKTHTGKYALVAHTVCSFVRAVHSCQRGFLLAGVENLIARIKQLVSMI